MGALGSLLAGLGGSKEPWPGSMADHGRELLPPPGEIPDLDPQPSHVYSTFRGQRNEEKGTLELKNREKYQKKS